MAPSGSSPSSSPSSSPGRTRTVDCDLVVFTADWIPDHELAVMAGCELDLGSLGPLVDPALRTTRIGVFAAGNLLHPAETADVCALDGRHAAPAVAAYLRGPGDWPSPVRLTARAPLAWVAPNLAAGDGRRRPARPLPAALAPSSCAAPGFRSVRAGGAVERPGRPAGARALGPYPRRLGSMSIPLQAP